MKLQRRKTLHCHKQSEKSISADEEKNGKVEICGMHKGTMDPCGGEVKEDLRREARAAMMEENKAALSSMYTIDDNLMTVFCFEHGQPRSTPLTADPKVIQL